MMSFRFVLTIITVVQSYLFSLNRGEVCNKVPCLGSSYAQDFQNPYYYNVNSYPQQDPEEFIFSFWLNIQTLNPQYILTYSYSGTTLFQVFADYGYFKINSINDGIFDQTNVQLPQIGAWVLYIFNIYQYSSYSAYINIYYVTETNLQYRYYLSGFSLWDSYGDGYLHVMLGQINLFQDAIYGNLIDKAFNIKIGDYNNIFGLLNLFDNLPQKNLLHMTFEEKIQSQILCDWTMNHYPMLGTSYQPDVNDPLIKPDGIYFSNNQVVTINNVTLPTSFSIIAQMTISNPEGQFQVFQITDQYGQLMSLGVNNYDILITISGYSFTLSYCFYSYQNQLSISFRYFKHPYSDQYALFELACYYQGDTIGSMSYQVTVLNFKTQWQVQLGSLQNMDGSQFIFRRFLINQGVEGLYNNNNIYLCSIELNNQCLICQLGYFLSPQNNFCTPSCNEMSYMQSYDYFTQLCVRICHPTCSTCNDPTVCLACDGIRINPPSCICPPGYFDDQINPNCIQYLTVPQIQQGKLEFSCLSGIYDVQVDFPYIYTIIPQVVISIEGLSQISQGLYSAIVSSITNSHFVVTFNCISQTLFTISWLSEPGNYIISRQIPFNLASGFSGLSYGTSFTVGYQSVASLTGIQQATSSNQGGKLSTSTSSVFCNMYSTTTQINFQIVEYKSFVTSAYSISTIGYMPNYFGSLSTQWYFDTTNMPTNAQFILIPTSAQFYQSAIKYILQVDQATYGFYLNLITDGNAPEISFDLIGLFGLTLCTDPNQSCNLQDILIYNCQTNAGYYLDQNYNCLPCSSPCTTCMTDSKICTTCPSTLFLSESQCICNSNYYIDATLTCQPCYSSCQTCVGGALNQCESCIPGLVLSTNTCVCPDGYYFDTISLICSGCQYSCQTCSDSVSCNSCPVDRVQNISTLLCDCNPGTYDFNQVCTICDSRCLTCSGSNTSCNSCDLNQLRTYDSIALACPCISGYYEDAQSLICLPCNITCVTCSGASETQCLSCLAVATFTSGSCVCASGQYFDAELISCSPCSTNCSTCIVTSTNCQTCPINMGLDQTNQCICLDGFYFNGTICASCPGDCTLCTSATVCTACPPDKYLLSGTCLCNDGFYDLNFACTGINYYYNITFLACDGTCATCNTSPGCLTCSIDKILSGSSCICNPGYWMNGFNCTICDQSCATCADGTSCLSCSLNRVITALLCVCQDGYFEDITLSCSLCDITCLTCVTQNYNCLTCDSTQLRVFAANSCPCQNGYYSDSAFICQICHGNCQTCNGPEINNCQSCQLPKLFSNGDCICPDGQYLDSLFICQLCDVNCITCSSLTVCLSCDSTKQLSSGSCICPSDQYMDANFVCQKCDQSCLTCSGPLNTNCLSCLSSRNLTADQACICADGYFIDGILCTACQINCLTCVDINSCSTCPPNSAIKNSICSCNQGYFQVAGKRQCSQCSPKCLTCSQLTQCLTCDGVANRKLVQSDCVCNDGYYENSQKQCISCQDKSAIMIKSCNYKNCNDGIWTTAEECDDGNQVPRDGCTDCKIDDGYKCVNVLLAPSFCYKCPSNCVECAPTNRVVKCSKCSDGYFSSQNKCVKCGSNCKTCSQMNYCLTCFTNGKEPNEQGVCPTCEQTPGTYTVDGNCVTKCGDGIETSDEECDDNNSNDGDGCSSTCSVENGFICTNGICKKKPLPEVQASYVNTTTTNIIQIQCDATIDKFCQKITAKIDDFQATDFELRTTKLMDDNNGQKCSLEFIYNKTILETNLIRIFVPLTNTNSSSRVLSDEVRELVITPRRQIFYSQSQLAQAQTVSNAQDTMTYLLYFVGPAAILLGGFNFFWTLLDILTWLNNLYYINVYFPANVSLIFQQSVWASISLIPTIIQFNQPDDPYYRESPPRYMDKGVDPFFFNNAYQDAGIWSGAILFYFIASLIIKIVESDQKKLIKSRSTGQSSKILQLRSEVICDVEIKKIKHINTQKHNIVVQKLVNFAHDYQQNVIAYLIKTLNLTFLDLVSAIILQLMFYDIAQCKYVLVFANFVCAYFCIGVSILTVYLSYNVSVQHKELSRHRMQKLRYGTLYEGIDIDSESGMMYSFINLMRKTLFIGFQIYFYYKPLFQAAACSFISFLNVGFIIYANPFETKKILLQNAIPDTCIFLLMIICTILAIDDRVGVLDAEKRFFIGWIMLGVIGLSIMTQIVFLMMQFIEDAISNGRAVIKYINGLFK